MKRILISSMAGCAVLLGACVTEGPDLQSSNDVEAVELTLTDRSQEDFQYMMQLAQSTDLPYVKIDVADPIQYRYIRKVLARQGMTPQTHPDLFQGIEEAHRLALQLGDERQSVPSLSDEMEAGYTHLIANILPRNGNSLDLTSDAYLSVPEGTPYATLTHYVMDNNGNPLSEGVSIEEYDGGTDLTANVEGMLQTGDTDGEESRCVYADSTATTFRDGVARITWVPVNSCDSRSGVLQDPRDQELPGVPLDGIITVCLNRSWLYDAYDCEYTMEGTGSNLIFPLKGEMEFGGTVVELVKAWASMGLPNNGGGCNPSLNFLDAITIDADNPRRISWDIPRADFGGRCFAHQQEVALNIAVEVIVENAGTTLPGFGSISSQTIEPGAIIDKIKFAFSCLAEGTQIRMADGLLMPIETIEQDDQILADRDGMVLSVMDMSIGVEDLPMYRLWDSLGHSLLLTGGHPVVLSHGEVVRTDQIFLGDELITEEGPSIVTRIDLEVYDGQVFNLKLGNDRERRYVERNETTMFANGILVGDGRVQSNIEFIDRSPVSLIGRIE